jgi:hypothetical protein
MTRDWEKTSIAKTSVIAVPRGVITKGNSPGA